MQRRPVCAIEDLPPGSMKLVQAGKFGVGVYNIDGALYAIANYCSHEGAPLCAGYVVGTNEFAPDQPGQLRRVREGRIARCPWHNWEFRRVLFRSKLPVVPGTACNPSFSDPAQLGV